MAVALACGLSSATPAHANSTDNMVYNAGNVMEGVMTGHPHVYLVFAGSQWGTPSTDSAGITSFSNDPSGAAPQMQNFFRGLGTENDQWSGIMTQYCENVPSNSQGCPFTSNSHVGYPTGGALAGVWVDENSAAPDNVTGFSTDDEAQAAALHFGHPTDLSNASNIYVVMWPHGIWPHLFNSSACAMHQSTGASTLFLYGPGAILGNAPSVAWVDLPYVTDHINCASPGGYTNAGFTWFAAHEYAETLTEPFLDSNGNGGWWGGTATDESPGLPRGPWNDEIGDKCEDHAPGQLTLATGTFVVPPLWSNTDNGCVYGHTVMQGGGIVNGGFEAPTPFGWDGTGNVGISSVRRSGQGAAQIGAAGAGDSKISQTFTAPGGSKTLSFWYNASCSNPAQDWTSVVLADKTMATTATPVPATCVSGAGWAPVTVPVTPGDTYTLTLTNHDVGDPSHPNITFLDDVTTSSIAPQYMPPPTGAHVTSGGYLTWTAPSTPAQITGYVISRDNDYAVAVVPANSAGLQPSWQDPLDPLASKHVSHTYEIRAYTVGSDGVVVAVSDPVRVAEAPVNVVRGPLGQVCWDPIMGFNGTNDEYGLNVPGAAQPVYVSAAGHDPKTQVCWTPFTGDPYGWTIGSTQNINVFAYSPGVLKSDTSATLGYVYVPAVGGQYGTQYDCVYENAKYQCAMAVNTVGTAVTGATSYNVYRNGTPVASGLTFPSTWTTIGYWDFDVTVGTTNTYQITAVINGVEGLASNWPAHVSITAH